MQVVDRERNELRYTRNLHWKFSVTPSVLQLVIFLIVVKIRVVSCILIFFIDKSYPAKQVGLTWSFPVIENYYLCMFSNMDILAHFQVTIFTYGKNSSFYILWKMAFPPDSPFWYESDFLY